MFASFTQGEKTLLGFFALLLAGGLGAEAFWDSSSKKTLFMPVTSVSTGTVELKSPRSGQSNTKLNKALAPDGKVDVNNASAEVLQTLPGVGPRLAEEIIGSRKALGGFRSEADMDKVPGIGPAMLAKLSPHVSYASMQGLPAAPSAGAPYNPASATPSGTRPAAPTPALSILPQHQANPANPIFRPDNNVPLNINTATAEQLETLAGVGPVLAKRIVEYRSSIRAFTRIEDLDAVKGIGPAILRENRTRICVR